MDAGTRASAAAGGSSAAQLDGFHAALIVSVVVALAGLAIAAAGVLPELRAWAARFRAAWQAAYAGAGDRS
jgi:hypothetical protein